MNASKKMPWNKVTSVISLFAIFFALAIFLFSSSRNVAYAATSPPHIIGEGSYEELGEEYFGYYRIETVEELYWFLGEANRDHSVSALLVSDIEINKDLTTLGITVDAKGEPSTVTGRPVREWTVVKEFSGTFDGGGHTISGVYIKSVESYIGMFATLQDGGVIKNLTVADSYVYSSGDYAGVLTGNNEGEINGATICASVACHEFSGGVAGINYGEIEMSRLVGSAELYVGAQADKHAGGIVGENCGCISYCYSGSGSYVWGSYSGGIAGLANIGEISYCYSTSDVGGEKSAPIVRDYEGGARFKSNYYLGEVELDGINGTAYKGRDAFLSGEVCYLLNVGGERYFQTVNEGEPTFSGDRVFLCKMKECPESDAVGVFYSNTEGDRINYPDHKYGFECEEFCDFCGTKRNVDKIHTFVDNCDANCDICGETREPTHEYKYTCDKVCSACGEIREADHIYSSDCDEDCNECGVKRDAVPHKFANCFDIDCNSCGAVRGDVGHKFDNDCDPDCNVCGELRDASHEYENACDSICNKCGYERVARHSYTSPCDTTCDNGCGFIREDVEEHTYKFPCDDDCEACGFVRENVEHTYDNACDSICNGCEETRQVGDHVYSANCDKYCDECGFLRNADHTYDDECDSTCKWCDHTRDDAPHVFLYSCSTQCSKCEYEREASHVYDDGCDATCNECGEERQAHAFSGDCDEYCDLCNYYRGEKDSHAYKNACDIDCDVCGAIRESRHDYPFDCSTKCSVCGVSRGDSAPHSFVYACDQKCSVCEEALDGEHQYDHECDAFCNICEGERQVDDHIFENDCDDDCQICGFSREVGDHLFENDCDADCKICGAIREVGGHKYTNGCDADCNVCGARRTPESHKYDHGCDSECNVCGFVREVGEHDFGEYIIEVEPTEDEAGLRSRECVNCGARESEAIDPIEGSDDSAGLIVAIIIIGALLVMGIAFVITKKTS